MNDDATRQHILECTKLAREGRIEKRNAPFAEHVARIPESDWKVICALFPGLTSRDPDEQNEAREAFLASEASAPYRVQRRVMGERPRGIIVRPAPVSS